jgi:hypothetical protein
MDAQFHIPLYRFGQVYESLDATDLTDFRGETIPARVSQANAGLIRRDLRKISHNFDVLQSRTTAEMFDICGRAGDLFLNAEIPVSETTSHSPDDYVASLSSTGGLPQSLCLANMKKIHQVLQSMPEILGGLTRGLDTAVLDHGLNRQDGQLSVFIRPPIAWE